MRRADVAAAAEQANVFSYITLFSMVFFGVGSAILDLSPPGAPLGRMMTLLAWTTVLLETIGQAFTAPWISGGAPPDCTTADGTAALNWIWGLFGCLLDGVFVVEGGSRAANTSDRGIDIAVAYAVGQLTIAIVAAIPGTPAATASNILYSIPALSKYGLRKSIIARTGGKSLLVVAGIDAAFNIAAAAVDFSSAQSTLHFAEPIMVTA
jgi:hypothetical protein